MPFFLRIWRGSSSLGRCRDCHKPIMWVIDDRGKSLPFRNGATPIRTEESVANGARFDVYDASTAFHSAVCTRPKAKPARPSKPQQEKLL